jgi:transcriptional regulator with XRE-family HTH domain
MTPFGATLRQLRETREIGLRELARRLDVDPSYLSKIERRTLPPPRPGRIRDLALALHADANLLLAVAALDRLPRAARAHLVAFAK